MSFGKPPAMEVRANLQCLKELLETGHVKTMDYAVAGKFRALIECTDHSHSIIASIVSC